jgi:CheY-like chemotaxis protein
MAHVLVVDDDELVRSTIRASLARAGHDVIEARDGQEAVDILARGPVDVVVSDIIMPEIDGIGLLLQLRRQQPRLRVIVISGGGRTQNVDFLRMATALGADLALAKPFTPEDLQRAVQSVLEGPTDKTGPDS